MEQLLVLAMCLPCRCLFGSLKMLMVWRSLLPRSCASITLRISALSAELGDSTTFMVRLEHGKVVSNARNRHVLIEGISRQCLRKV